MSRLIFGCLVVLCACGGDDSDAPPSAEGTWILHSTDATCQAGFTGGAPAVESVALSVEEGEASFSVAPCFGAQSGSLVEGESGFVAMLLSSSQETSTLVCQGEGADAYVCEHDWLEGEFRLQRL